MPLSVSESEVQCYKDVRAKFDRGTAELCLNQDRHAIELGFIPASPSCPAVVYFDPGSVFVCLTTQVRVTP